MSAPLNRSEHLRIVTIGSRQDTLDAREYSMICTPDELMEPDDETAND